MKLINLLMSILFTVSLFTINKSQSLVCMAPDEVDSKTESFTILVKTTSPLVKKVRIISENTGETSYQAMTQNKTHSVSLKLETGKNTFNILGYRVIDDENDELIPTEICRVTVKKSKPTQESASVNNSSTAQGSNSASPKPNPSPTAAPETKTQSKDFRAIVGLEVVGASSSPSKQQPFFDLYFSTPIGSPYSKRTGLKKNVQLSIWGNTRFASLPVQNITSLSGFTVPTFANNFVGSESSTKFNELVQSFEFRAGLELQVFQSFRPYAGLYPGRSSVSLILSAGAVTPLSAEKGSLFYEVPKVNNDVDIDPRFKELFPNVTTQKTIAFATPERDRFYRQYFAGFRIKTHYLKTSDSEENSMENYIERDDLVPGMFDITFGQNEAITNRLKGVVLRLDGSIPIPIYGNTLFIFGSAQMRMGKNLNNPLPSIFLKPSSPIELSSSDVFVVSAEQNPLFRSNRDTFRIGVGVDLLKLFSPKTKNSENPQTTKNNPDESDKKKNLNQ